VWAPYPVTIRIVIGHGSSGRVGSDAISDDCDGDAARIDVHCMLLGLLPDLLLVRKHKRHALYSHTSGDL